MRRFSVALLSALVFLGGIGAAKAAAADGDPGVTTRGEVTSSGSVYPYLFYTPNSYKPRQDVPLVVVVHGCQTTAEQEQALTRYDELAERKGFVVLYPDVDVIGQNAPGPIADCWKFYEPGSWTRGSGDSGAIAAMTRTVMDERSIDPERVYLAGTSAGGLMTAIDAAAYPDLFAAVAIMNSAGFLDQLCFTSGVGIPTPTSAQLAYAEMGERARVVPAFVLGGDEDLAFPWTCGREAMQQSLRTNNLVLSGGGSQVGPISLEPAEVNRRRKPGGHDYTVSTFRDPDGCLIGESWQVHGMGHFWSGGTKDPAYSGYTDVAGPSAAKKSWAFFRRFRLSETAPPCSAAPGCAEAKARHARAKERHRALKRSDAPNRKVGQAKRKLRQAKVTLRHSC